MPAIPLLSTTYMQVALCPHPRRHPMPLLQHFTSHTFSTNRQNNSNYDGEMVGFLLCGPSAL